MARKFNGYGRGGAGMGGGMNMSAMIKKAQKMQEEMVKAQRRSNILTILIILIFV